MIFAFIETSHCEYHNRLSLLGVWMGRKYELIDQDAQATYTQRTART